MHMNLIGGACLRFAKGHAVLLVSAACAIATMAAVPPDAAYASYIDWETIGCLFCVLAVANAFRLAGAFDFVARLFLEKLRTPRGIVAGLVAATGALSMFATNDLALIIMLPISLTSLAKAKRCRLIPVTFVLQGLAANLCGMIMPFGNPQNLFLYSYYSIGLGEFLRTMLPAFLLSVALLALFAWLLTRSERGGSVEVPPAPALSAGRGALAAYAALLALSISAVFRVVPVALAAAVVAGVLAFVQPRALRAVDWSLLLTFVCFFVFAGNVGRVPQLGALLSSLVQGSELLVAALLSQAISNVPAAVLLSHFTGDWAGLLVGVNIGGAGTLVGSMANLITLQHFMGAKKLLGARGAEELSTVRFMKVFTLLNAVFLAALLVQGLLLG